MCRVRATPVERSSPIANQYSSNTMNANKADATIHSTSQNSNLRVLICSENVPPQVNGIARRVGMYADGLRNLGCDVGKLFVMYNMPLQHCSYNLSIVSVSMYSQFSSCHLNVPHQMFYIPTLVCPRYSLTSIHGTSQLA